MRVTVCELPDDARRTEAAWSALVDRLASLMATVSGCFVASANRRAHEDGRFAGQSCIVSREGEIL